MPELIEGKHAGEFIAYEAPHYMSREEVTVLSGESVVVGEVVGKVTASGKVVPLAPAAVDGSEVAFGIMVDAVDASAADADGIVINYHAVVQDADLTWPAGITDVQKATAIAELRKSGVQVR